MVLVLSETKTKYALNNNVHIKNVECAGLQKQKDRSIPALRCSRPTCNENEKRMETASRKFLVTISAVTPFIAYLKRARFML